MNNNSLYNNIMRKISVQVKNALNESEGFSDVTEIIDPALIFEENGETYINLSDLSLIDPDAINAITSEIASDGDCEIMDSNEHGKEKILYITPNGGNDIICRSAEKYEISICLTAECDVTTSYHKGRGYFDYDLEPDDDEVTGEIDSISVHDVELTDGDENIVKITDEDTIDYISDQIDDSLFDDYIQYEKETYDPNEPYYEKGR